MRNAVFPVSFENFWNWLGKDLFSFLHSSELIWELELIFSLNELHMHCKNNDLQNYVKISANIYFNFDSEKNFRFWCIKVYIFFHLNVILWVILFGV